MLNISDDNRITLTKGDTLPLQVSIKTVDGQTYTPVEGDQLRFAISIGYKGTPLYQLILSMPIDLATLELVIPAEETAKLKYMTYNYDVELTHADGTVDTFISSELTITGEVE